MSKYANLPDIDTAPDIYETEDVFPTTTAKDDYSDEETGLPTRGGARGKNELPSKEELDGAHLIDADEASRLFKRAERRRPKTKGVYSFPRSRTPSPSSSKPPPLSVRLKQLQAELVSLESELADPASLQDDQVDGPVDPAELIRGLVDVKSRLEKISHARNKRLRLVQGVMQDEEPKDKADNPDAKKDAAAEKPEEGSEKSTARDAAEIDKRVGELEKVVGSASTSLDETSPMPQPLLPLLTRLSTQLNVLTQPRHLDNISRRLKLLLTDLDRLSASNKHQRQLSTNDASSGPAAPSAIQDQLAPLLTRLVPMLPHIPHILARLRTLAALHTSAADFSRTLDGLEEDQRRVRDLLGELERAVTSVEGSLKENGEVVKKNVAGLEDRISQLTERLDKLATY
ncbi:hypothetical protein PENSPDRAFT_680288 [Peniophora sp. CONT]|nr:hypothetical protein PENSPDRAFT_680288 [Peniophora sp. CONT]